MIDKQSNINESSNASNSYLQSLFFAHKTIPYFKVCSFYFSGTQNFVDFHQAVNWLASQRSIKPIGPMIPSFYLDKQLEDDKEYGSQRIGKEKTSKQLCGGVIKEISACDLEPAARGSGSQVRRWLLHDSLWVELNTRGVELRSANGGNARVD
ncbi:hypothetical protein D5086_031193 [Populus alba]|uniref:Uncharacterized protein n=1 Tax=Populus alba TaxID=43335 RepID=A0ACC4AQM6_POPAL